jgi:hypothetical protein
MTAPNGVEVSGLGAVGIYIPQWSTDANGYFTGTHTDGASVTNWTTGTNTYAIQLDCTHNVDNRHTAGTEAGGP